MERRQGWMAVSFCRDIPHVSQALAVLCSKPGCAKGEGAVYTHVGGRLQSHLAQDTIPLYTTAASAPRVNKPFCHSFKLHQN